MPYRAFAILSYLCAVSAIAVAVWWFALGAALDKAAETGRGNLSLAADRLTLELQRYRELAVVLADHPTLTGMLDEERAPPAGAADALLRGVADMTRAYDIALFGADGTVLAAAEGVGTTKAPGPFLRRAFHGALGLSHGQIGPDGVRAFTYGAPVFGADKSVTGVVAVSVRLDSIEWDWQGDPQAIYFTDRAGVVFVSNRRELLLTARDPSVSGPYLPGVLRPFVEADIGMHGPHELWRIEGGPYLPSRAMHLTLPLPVIGLTAELLMDVAPVQRVAVLQAAVAAALLLIVGAALFLLSERRRALAAQLAIEERAKAVLETRVAARTADLSKANTRLTREVRERRDAEAALKRAQADLVQAGKLSALGQMSAGISHELNQPLMAIRSFAENGEQFLARGDVETAGRNMARIGDLARRMGRIIKNLRAFARHESEPAVDVNLVASVEAALELSEARMRQAGVDLDWVAPPGPVWVRGGDVRLQQVILNLVSNGTDAMEGREDKQLTVRIEAGPGGRVRLRVRDTGPGLREAAKIFDPFYSTKEVGPGEGMGLGLSISYGIVQSFGGDIRGHTHPEGGAEFTVDLPPAQSDEAAA